MTDTDTSYREPTAVRVSLRTAAILLAYMLVFTGVVAGTYLSTEAQIAVSAEAEKLRLVNEVLPVSLYDNDLLRDHVLLPPQTALNTMGETTVYRARREGRPVALIVEAIAPDGYSGKIGLLLAVSAEGKLLALRVTQHKETPGLGDYIDPKKDRNKRRPWITQFNGLGFSEVPQTLWRVKKDGGNFDQMAGATISARAVTNASARALSWVDAHQAKLFSLAANQRMEATE